MFSLRMASAPASSPPPGAPCGGRGGGGIRKPVMVGAIPFDTCQPSELYIPERWEAFSRPEKQRSARYAAPLEAMEVVERREIPEQDAFLAMVERAAALTATPEVDKVVISRLSILPPATASIAAR